MLSGSATDFASDTARAGQPLATDTELGLPLDEDPAADVSDLDDSPPLGLMPVFHRRVIKPAMQPTKARLLSCPGRGPVPLPTSLHPKARPFGVAYSSLALREAAQLRAKDPIARQLISARHPPPKPELGLPEGFEMPEKLPSPETAAALLAQANRAHQRSLDLTKQLVDDSTYAPPAGAGTSAAATGTAGDFIKDHPLINPRAQANPHIADDVPSLEAARAALEQFQTERMATLGSASEPLASAQEQLAALAASHGRAHANTPFCETQTARQACVYA